MKTINDFIILLFIIISGSTNAQIGLGTNTPDVSSVLDIVSTDKGLLSPRMTKTERDEIQNPATGLLIYNTSSSRFNYYNAGWKDFSTDYNSISAIDTTKTTSNTDVLMPQMKLVPKAGKYLVNFSCQYINNSSLLPPSSGINTPQCLADLSSVYNKLNIFPTTSNHGANFNFGGTLLAPEVITPGKYSLNSAIAVSGYLTLDAGGDANAVFIFQANGALNVSAGTQINLIGGAQSCNVFWVGIGAVNVGSDATMVGILLSKGFAVAVGARTSLDGRMFTTAGAIAFGPGIATSPTALSTKFDLKSLSTFVAFSGLGAINNTGTPLTSTYFGDIASNNGATGSLLNATVNGTIYPSGSTQSIPFVLCTANFSIYQNGVLIPGSIRVLNSKISSSNISLQAIASVVEGESIEIKWRTNFSTLTTGSRTLSLVKVNGL
ncbi:Ice-binding protein [Flavobacteriaceae bacterium]